MQTTVEFLQVQYIDKIVHVSVVMQRQIPTIQTMQKTVEVPLVQFLDRVVDVPVVMQRQVPCTLMPQDRIHESIVGETNDVTVPQVKEETVEIMKHLSTGACAEQHRGANRCRASSSDSRGNWADDPAYSARTSFRSCR